MKVPDERDWGDWGSDLDRRAAQAAFFGKPIKEAEKEFAAYPIERAENLRFMPPAPFQYYVQALRNFVLSPRAKKQSDAASTYLRLLQDKLDNDPATVMALMPSLLPSVDSVAERQTFYEADEDIYGSFPKMREQLRRTYQMRLSGKS